MFEVLFRPVHAGLATRQSGSAGGKTSYVEFGPQVERAAGVLLLDMQNSLHFGAGRSSN